MTNKDRLLPQYKQLWISVWFNSLLTDRELNRSATLILLSYRTLDHIDNLLEQDFDPYEEQLIVEPAYCAGSGASFPSSSSSALCYCGRTFHRRVDCRQKTWSIRKHQPFKLKGTAQ